MLGIQNLGFGILIAVLPSCMNLEKKFFSKINAYNFKW